MNEVLQTNVFFVITSIAVLVLTILMSVALVYLIRILRNVSEISARVRRGSEQLAEDATAVRSFFNEGIVGNVKNFLTFFSRGSAGSKTKKKDRDDSTNN